jgi:hypothetical protein
MTNYSPIAVDLVFEGTLALAELGDHEGILTLKLTDKNGKLFEVQFEDYVAYRKYAEGDAHRTLAELERSGDATKIFYEAKNSEFLLWLNAESSEFYGLDRTRTIHTLIAALDDMLDVISLSPAKFVSVNSKTK